MSSSTTNLDLIATSQAQKEVTANAMFDATSPSMIFGRRASTCGGLTFGYYGGQFTKLDGSNVAIPNGTLSLTASASNYVEVSSAGVVSANSTAFTAGRTPLYVIIAGISTVTSYTDKRDGTQGNFLAGGAAGTVTSVAMTTPGVLYSVSGSPVTSSGTLALSLINQAANAVLAGPTSGGSAAPSFRALTIDDLNFADTDGTLAANSDTKVATQKAVATYVATQLDGRSWKQRVRAATTANGSLAAAFANGQAIDGVTLATGDRILIKNQTTASENGIYVVATSGAPTRSSDADTSGELVNATVEVSEGAANADLQFTCATNSPITVGTTALVFVTTSTSTTYSADEITLHLSGAQFSLLSTAPVTHAAAAKTAPIDADEFGIVDSAASNVLKKVTWANLKATLKTYLDTLYAPLSQPFDLTAFYPGVPSASARVTRVPVARAVAFAANFAGSYGVASVAATASTAFDVRKNGSSVGTITFAAGASTATFTTSGGSAVTLTAGDYIGIVSPATPDATLADVGFVLAGTR